MFGGQVLSWKEMRRELPLGKIRVLMSGEGGRNGRTGRSGRQGTVLQREVSQTNWTVQSRKLGSGCLKWGTKLLMNVYQDLSFQAKYFFHRLLLVWIRLPFFVKYWGWKNQSEAEVNGIVVCSTLPCNLTWVGQPCRLNRKLLVNITEMERD